MVAMTMRAVVSAWSVCFQTIGLIETVQDDISSSSFDMFVTSNFIHYLYHTKTLRTGNVRYWRLMVNIFVHVKYCFSEFSTAWSIKGLKIGQYRIEKFVVHCVRASVIERILQERKKFPYIIHVCLSMDIVFFGLWRFWPSDKNIG